MSYLATRHSPESSGNTIAGRKIPLRDCRTAGNHYDWRGEGKYNSDDYGEVYGVIPRFSDIVVVDIDPKKVPTVKTDWSEWLGNSSAKDTVKQTTPHGGEHQLFLVPPGMRGRIRQGQDKPIPGVDIVFSTYIKTGAGYEWNCPTLVVPEGETGLGLLEVFGEIAPMPKKLPEHFEKEAKGQREVPAARDDEGKGHVSPAMYMEAAEPEQQYSAWRKQCDSLMAGGASVDDVLRWCSRGAKFDPYADRAILEGSLRKGLGITSGWYATDYYRRRGKDIPRMDGPDNGQWRCSKEWNRQRRIRLTINEGEVFNLFMRREMDIDSIADLKETDRRTVRRWLRSSTDRHQGKESPLTSYVTSVAKVSPGILSAGRYFRLGKSLNWIAAKMDVDRRQVLRWRAMWKKNPLLGYSRKQVLKMARKDELAKKRAAKRIAKPEHPTPPKTRLRVRALVRESKSEWLREEGLRVYHNREGWIDGWWNGRTLEIDGETTPTGRPKRKRKETILKMVGLPPSLDGRC
ncbi:MAG: hypothetical protein OXQ90_03845 [Gammaproteobacteria bacterium]|nr:hypothetical protein [Gammaproteobacteria bacterium]